MYNSKNYMEDGKWFIGGELVIDKNASITGLRAENVEAASTTSGSSLRDKLNEVIAAMKDGGLMVPDTWTISTKAVPGGSAQMPTPETTANSAHAVVTADGTEITVTLDCKIADLADADHGSTWGVHKWLGFGVTTGLDSIVGIKYNGTALTAADASEASDLGLSAGDFVLYIRAEQPEFVAGGYKFTLWASGYAETEFTVKIIEAAE